jgi:hypothetical protein
VRAFSPLPSHAATNHQRLRAAPHSHQFAYRLTVLPSYRLTVCVDVETDIANGLPSFTTVGLPQGAVKEGRERVGAAVANSDFAFPLKRITGLMPSRKRIAPPYTAY